MPTISQLAINLQRSVAHLDGDTELERLCERALDHRPGAREELAARMLAEHHGVSWAVVVYGDGHDDRGWYYFLADSPEAGSVGAFADREEAVAEAVAEGCSVRPGLAVSYYPDDNIIEQTLNFNGLEDTMKRINAFSRLEQSMPRTIYRKCSCGETAHDAYAARLNGGEYRCRKCNSKRVYRPLWFRRLNG